MNVLKCTKNTKQIQKPNENRKPKQNSLQTTLIDVCGAGPVVGATGLSIWHWNSLPTIGNSIVQLSGNCWKLTRPALIVGCPQLAGLRHKD